MSDKKPDDSLIVSVRSACSGSVDDVRKVLDLKTNSIVIQMAVEIAQAAERTFQLAEQTKLIIESHPIHVRHKVSVDTSKLSDYSSPYFTEFVVDRSLEILTRVRAAERLSMMLCKYESECVNGAIQDPGNPGNMKSLGRRPADILCHAGVFFYELAAAQLAGQKQDRAAQLLGAVSNVLSEKNPKSSGGILGDIIQKIGINYRIRHETYARLRYKSQGMERPSVDLLVKLARAFDSGPYRAVPTFISASKHKLHC